MARYYRELIVWQKAMDLALAAYELASMLPADERFGLCSQIRRAATSIPANVAEGHERRSRRDYRRFVTIACGSIAELETHLELCRRLGYLEPEVTFLAESLVDEVGRLLRAIERSLARNSPGPRISGSFPVAYT